MSKIKISIIVPVLNEAIGLASFLSGVQQRMYDSHKCEILLIDGGSTDQTVSTAVNSGIKIWKSPKGRAKQMNMGVSKASGDVLYFLHADTIPPPHFDRFITEAVHTGTKAGCFRMKFDSGNYILRVSSWFTRFNFLLCRGGDQSLFVTKNTFLELGGFDEDFIIYEDCEFISRLYRSTTFRVLPHFVISSARKYRSLGTVYLQFHFGMIHLMNFLGLGPGKLHRYYEKRISSRLA